MVKNIAAGKHNQGWLSRMMSASSEVVNPSVFNIFTGEGAKQLVRNRMVLER